MAGRNYLRRVTSRWRTSDRARTKTDDEDGRPSDDEAGPSPAGTDEGTVAGTATAAGDARTARTDGGRAVLEREPDDAGGGGPDVDARVDRATAAVSYTAETERTLTERVDEDLGIDAAAIGSVSPVEVPAGALARQTRLLSTTFADRADDRAARIADVAGDLAAGSVPPSAYVAAYERVVDRLIERTFDDLEAGGDVEAARETLRAGIDATFVDLQVGVDEFADADVVATADEDDEGREVGVAEVLDALPDPAFLIADDHTVLGYNTGFNRLFSLDDDHSEYLGRDSRETIAAAAYTDGRRHHSLADKIVEDHNGVGDWDLTYDDDDEFTDHRVYRDTSVTVDHTGRESHVEMLAMTLYDDGELCAVLELIRDRSEEMRRQQAVEALITEVTETLAAIGAGDLSARARFEDDHDVIESNLLALTDDVNGMAANFEEVVTRVDDKTTELAASIERATEYADRIDDRATSQNESLEIVADEMEDFSATMEEVAASSEEVAEAAEAALEEAESGVQAGEDATAVTDEVAAISEDLVETVERLDEYMGEIGEVAEVIADVADQTNLLALNANIEAAKADEAGAGFAVVADEVKSLAAETQAHTDEIASRIEQVQEQTAETVDEVETSHEHIQAVETEIDTVLDALETISVRVESAVDGIQEVAGANDKQAASVEEVMATIEDVRESSTRVTQTTEEIVAETDEQEAAVFELADRVEQMTGD